MERDGEFAAGVFFVFSSLAWLASLMKAAFTWTARTWNEIGSGTRRRRPLSFSSKPRWCEVKRVFVAPRTRPHAWNSSACSVFSLERLRLKNAYTNNYGQHFPLVINTLHLVHGEQTKVLICPMCDPQGGNIGPHNSDMTTERWSRISSRTRFPGFPADQKGFTSQFNWIPLKR